MTSACGEAADRPWLAIDTATDTASIGILCNDALLSEEYWTTRRRHTVQLAPRVSRMLEEHGLYPGDLGGIAVAVGPGSYTGLRIGLSLAKGLALGADLDVVGVPTLDVLAAALSPPAMFSRPRLWAVLRAGRGRVVAAEYPPIDRALPEGHPKPALSEVHADWPDPHDLSVWTAAELLERVEPGDLVAGELDAELRPSLVEVGCTVSSPMDCVRRAGWLALLGRSRTSRPDRPSVEDLSPVYSR